MEGPYRDLGNGFARLLGAEGARRSPTRLRSVEDALYDLLRNSRDARARNIYVATSLHARRYRYLVVMDDGSGIPDTHKHLVFEPGVTTRHIDPASAAPDAKDSSHGAGLALYHIKNTALSAEVLSASSPTAIKVVFDTRTLPEKSLQSGARPSKTNLPATLAKFASNPTPAQPRLYHASPASILARLLKNHIIRSSTSGRQQAGRVREEALKLGLEVSLRTVQRILSGRVPPAEEFSAAAWTNGTGGTTHGNGYGVDPRASGGRSEIMPRQPYQSTSEGYLGPILRVGAEDLAEIRSILRKAAGSSYLELEGLDVEARPGEVILTARIYEAEEEYE